MTKSRNLGKEVTIQDEAIEEYERHKLNAERIRKKLECELADLQVSLLFLSPSSLFHLFYHHSFLSLFIIL